MSIIIPHRFISRLLPHKEIRFINTLIIGTFNPGAPDFALLTEEEKKDFEKIRSSRRFQKFNQVLNFYDRPQNRFWKIMDVLANAAVYMDGDFSVKNVQGLKYYNKMDRQSVFIAQEAFCRQRGIWITDIVRKVQPDSFEHIYNNFPDKAIENSACTWNTEGILQAIEIFQPKSVLVNFKIGGQIPKISAQIEIIRKRYKERMHFVPSTSGAAGYTYHELVNAWSDHFTNL